MRSIIKSWKPEERAAPLFLKDYLLNLSPYVYSEDYSAESAILGKFHQDYLEKAEIKATVAAIKADDWLARINDANLAFEAKYQARTEHIGMDEAKEKYSKPRKPSRQAYYDLVEIINARYVVALYEEQDLSGNQNLINTINALIAQTERIIANTKPRGGKDPGAAPADGSGE